MQVMKEQQAGSPAKTKTVSGTVSADPSVPASPAASASSKMVLTAMMIALTAVATMVLAIPVPFTNGYIHLGDSMIFLSVLILGWKYGAAAAGVGSAMADLILGYIHWVPWTLGIKGLMAVLAGLAIEACVNRKRNTAIICAGASLLWVGFHIAVNRIVAYQAVVNPQALLSDKAADVNALGDFINSVQSQLMVGALAIPAALVIIALVLKARENILIPIHEITAMTLAGLWMVFGYYIAGGVMYGNFAISAFSIPMNIIQFVVGFILAVLLSAALLKTPAGRYFTYGKKQ